MSSLTANLTDAQMTQTRDFFERLKQAGVSPEHYQALGDALENGILEEVSLSADRYELNLYGPGRSSHWAVIYTGSGFRTAGWDGYPTTLTEGAIDIATVINSIVIHNPQGHEMFVYRGGVSGIQMIGDEATQGSLNLRELQIGSPGEGTQVLIKGDLTATLTSPDIQLSGLLTEVALYVRQGTEAYQLSIGGILEPSAQFIKQANGDISEITSNLSGQLDTLSLTRYGYSDADGQVEIARETLFAASQLQLTGEDLVALVAAATHDLGPDLGFDLDGQAVTDLGVQSDDHASSISLQSDGKILVAAFTDQYTDNPRLDLLRYNADGTLDGGFAQDGHYSFALPAGSGGATWAEATQRADGAIDLLALRNSNDLIRLRLTPGGSLDSSFDGDGIDAIDLGNLGTWLGQAAEAQVLADGKTLVSFSSGFKLARFNADGSLDTGFGGGDGIVELSAWGSAGQIQVLSDGSILAAGTTTNNQLTLARFTADGQLDNGFGSGSGYVTAVLGDWITPAALKLQADGKILVAGSSANWNSGSDLFLARFNADGTLDNSFNGGGLLSHDLGIALGQGATYDSLGKHSLHIDAQGDILLGGIGYPAAQPGQESVYAIVRYGADGQHKETLSAAIDPGINPVNLLLQPDGALLVAGSQSGDIQLNRLLPSKNVIEQILLSGDDDIRIDTGIAEPLNLHGYKGSDRIDTGAGDDRLAGGEGDDSLSGGAGHDQLTGGPGTDILTGGTGADRFVLDSRDGVDIITDFNPAEDRIVLAGTAFPDLTADRIYYDQFGMLAYYDFGAGDAQPVPIAILTGAPALQVADVLLSPDNRAVLMADSGVTDEDSALRLDIQANDYLPDGWDLNSIRVLEGGGSARLVDGQLEYIPGPGFQALKAGETGRARLEYSANSAAGAPVTGTVEVEVRGLNDSPSLAVMETSRNSLSYPGHSAGEFRNYGAFAAIKADGSVVTWGGSWSGGDGSAVAAQLDGAIDVTHVYSNATAFAALRADGSVVTWGGSSTGGDSSAAAAQLDGTIDVTQVYSTGSAFAALRADGSVVTWGSKYDGGDSSAVAAQLDGGIDATQVSSAGDAFAALRADGSVVTWGSSYRGGDSSAVAAQIDGMIDVTQVYSTSSAFAALRADGSVVTWGNSYGGGDSSGVASLLADDVTQIFSNQQNFVAWRADGAEVVWGSGGYWTAALPPAPAQGDSYSRIQVFSTGYAFAELWNDGSVSTWGSSWSGGDSSTVTAQLDGVIDVTQIYSTDSAFAARRADGSVVTWGNSGNGGDSAAVSAQLDGSIDVTQIYSTGGAFAALRADGSVVAWGSGWSGGDSSAVAAQLDGTNDVTHIHATNSAFAALRADGSVVTWGSGWNGGDSSAVAGQLASGVVSISDITTDTRPGNLRLEATAEGATDPAGARVLALVGGAYRDSDGDALAGVAIGGNAADAATQGRWQYSTDSGATWLDVGAVSQNAALLLDAASRLRFLPNAGYNGAPGALDLFAVDGSGATAFTSGASRQTFDTTTDGLTSKVSGEGIALVTSVLPDGGTPNAPPTGSVTITGMPGQGQILTASNSLADADGMGAVSYQWKADGQAIANATGSTFALSEAQVGKVITLTASYTDGQGTAETMTSAGTAAVANLNDAPTGSVTITGTAAQGQTLTASNSLADADGLGAISYQWRASGVVIAGATGASYTPGAAEAGKTITLTASYTDGRGTVESATSAATAAVAASGGQQGTSGNDTLIGGTAADTLIGGPGDDWYVVNSSSNVITELPGEGTDTVESSLSWTLGANLENLVLTGTGNRSGTGNSLDNRITGNDGNNTLDGGTGKDTLAGGLGNDTYVVDNAGDKIEETSTLATEIDAVRAGVSWSLGANLENLTLTGTKKFSGTGNTLANKLIGNGNANVLDGGTGSDILEGGAGNDTYVVDNLGDIINETRTTATEIDSVRASVSWTLGANLENLTLTGTKSLNGTGNALNNSLTGNGSANTLSGEGGNDIISGEAGNDTLYGGEGNDELKGGTGADRMDGGAGDDLYLFRQGDSTTLTFTDNGAGGLGDGDIFNFTGGVADLIVPGGFSGGDRVEFQANSQGVQLTGVLSTPPADGLTADQKYFLVGGTYNGASFTVDAAGADTLVVYDGNTTSSVSQTAFVIQGVSSRMLDAGNDGKILFNAAPVITSFGGGETASIEVPENGAYVTTFAATDANGDSLTWGLAASGDFNLFDIDAATGALRFKQAPDFERPADSDGDDVYEVGVTVSDGKGGWDVQSLAIRVTDLNEFTAGNDSYQLPAAKVPLTSLDALGGRDTLVFRPDYPDVTMPQGEGLHWGNALDPASYAGTIIYDLTRQGDGSYHLSGYRIEGQQAVIDYDLQLHNFEVLSFDDQQGNQLNIDLAADIGVIGAGQAVNGVLDGSASSLRFASFEAGDGVSSVIGGGSSMADTAVLSFAGISNLAMTKDETVGDDPVWRFKQDEIEVFNIIQSGSDWTIDKASTGVGADVTLSGVEFLQALGGQGETLVRLAFESGEPKQIMPLQPVGGGGGEDTTAPALTITSDKTLLKAGETAGISFRFSEVPVGFAVEDVTVTGGALSNFAVTADPRVYGATFIPAANQNGSAGVSVSQGAYTDAAGNAGGAGAGGTAIAFDTAIPAAPVLSLAADTGSSAQDGITRDGQVNVTGLEAVATWEYSTDGGLSWILGGGNSFTPNGDGEKTVRVRQIDPVGNVSEAALLGFRLDTTAPVGVDSAINGNLLTLTFSEALDGIHLPPLTSGAVKINGAPVAINGLVVEGNQAKLTLATAVSASDTLTISYTDPAAADDAYAMQDLAGNDLASLEDLLIQGPAQQFLAGTPGDDVISYPLGDLTGQESLNIQALAGDDQVDWSAGHDSIDGGSGYDVLNLPLSSSLSLSIPEAAIGGNHGLDILADGVKVYSLMENQPGLFSLSDAANTGITDLAGVEALAVNGSIPIHLLVDQWQPSEGVTQWDGTPWADTVQLDLGNVLAGHTLSLNGNQIIDQSNNGQILFEIAKSGEQITLANGGETTGILTSIERLEMTSFNTTLLTLDLQTIQQIV